MPQFSGFSESMQGIAIHREIICPDEGGENRSEKVIIVKRDKSLPPPRTI